MKKIFLRIVIALVLLCVLAFHINNNPRLIISSLLKKGQIQRGDLVYKVNLFGVLPVAQAIFKAETEEVYNGQVVYHLNTIASPSALFLKFFKGQAILDSFIDKLTFNPVLFRQKVASPGKEQASKEVFYDQANGVMTIKGERRQILPNTQDPLSLIFNLRRKDFTGLNKIEANINTNQKNYLLEGVVAKSSFYLINKTDYHTVELKATIRRRDKNNPYHRSSIDMVLLKEAANLPILIKVFASGMLINVKLVEIK